MPDNVSPAQQRLNARGNGTGNFNIQGKVLGGGDKEFYKRNDKWFVRNRPQTTKDRNAVAKEGKDPNATGGKQTELKKTLKLGSAKKEGAVLKGETSLKGSAGELGAKGQVLGGEVKAQANANFDNGVEVEGQIGAKGVLVGGELKYVAPKLNINVFGEECIVEFAIVASAEVAAEVGGKLSANVTGDKAGLSVGGDAFAGAKAGIKAELKLMWKPKGEKAQDLVGGSISAEGWAGVGVGGKAQIGLFPKIKANAHFSACVGIGGKLGGSIWMHAINSAKLGWILVAKGYKNAVEGLKKYSAAIASWIQQKAGTSYRELKKAFSQFADWLGTDDNARATVRKGYHKFLSARERGRLIKDMQSGSTGDDDEDAIVKILEFSSKNGDIRSMLRYTDGGASGIMWDLHGAQDTSAARIFRRHGIDY